MIVVGPAPCWPDDLASVPKGAKVAALCEAGLHLKKFDYWITCHPEMVDAWKRERPKWKGKVVCPPNPGGIGEIHRNLPLVSGSSSLYAVLWGIESFPGRIILAGCPMDAPQYSGFRAGWIHYAPILYGRVYSASGWTRGLLEHLGNVWPF